MATIRLLIAANIAVIDSYDHTLILQRLISVLNLLKFSIADDPFSWIFY
jgi:hypothetical protein